MADERHGVSTERSAPTAPKEPRKCCPIEGASESTASLNRRRSEAYRAFADLLGTTDLSTHDLVWTGGDCETCSPLNGTTFGAGWLAPPPLHHNCDCAINVRPKA